MGVLWKCNRGLCLCLRQTARSATRLQQCISKARQHKHPDINVEYQLINSSKIQRPDWILTQIGVACTAPTKRGWGTYFALDAGRSADWSPWGGTNTTFGVCTMEIRAGPLQERRSRLHSHQCHQRRDVKAKREGRCRSPRLRSPVASNGPRCLLMYLNVLSLYWAVIHSMRQVLPLYREVISVMREVLSLYRESPHCIGS